MRNFIVLLGFLLFQSCDHQNVVISQLDENGEISEFQSQLIVESQEFQTYFNLRISFLDNVKDALVSRYSVEELTEISLKALKGEEKNRYYEAIFSGYKEGNNFVINLNNARKALAEKFPILKEIRSDGDNNISKVYLLNLFNSIDEKWRSRQVLRSNQGIESGSPTSKEANKKDIVCGSYWQQVKLYACAGGCSFATGGIGTTLCGWGCWCMLCTKNSVMADIIC